MNIFDSEHAADIAARQIASLAVLPPSIEYFDDYFEVRRTIRNPARKDVWVVHHNGNESTLPIGQIPHAVRELVRRSVAWALSFLSPATATAMFKDLEWSIRTINIDVLLLPFISNAIEIKTNWDNVILPYLIDSGRSPSGIKLYYRFLCHHNLGCLDAGYLDFVSSFRGPANDLYASVRSGDPFLSELEELAIIDFFDHLSARPRLQTAELEIYRDACILLCSFQHAMRPIQIAKLKQTDLLVRLSDQQTLGGPVVHIRFSKEKQTDSGKRGSLLRKVKREWAILFVEYHQLLIRQPIISTNPGAVENSLFGLSPLDVSILIKKLSRSILSRDRSANDFRHTAAQRLVDGGASHEELAEFLGHSSVRTGLVYYSESITQAVRLNKALGGSDLYKEIRNIHRTRTIDKTKLITTPSDQQISGIAHGIPIAGIGRCQLGQSLCPKNPVLSCYGCMKFLPVSDQGIHQEVLDTLRPVVRNFFDASRGESQSPAYTQLRRTIIAVQRTIEELRRSDASE